jgi:hypothetical protein
MAIDTLLTSDTSDTQPGLLPTSGSAALGADAISTMAEAMWQQNPSLVRSQIMGVGPTGVGQNGASSLQNTAGIIRSLTVPAILPPPMQIRPERFLTLAKWVGRVQRVSDETFVALVEDRLENRPEEEVEFARGEVSPVDEPLLVPGAVFYWSIGYRDRLGGQRTRVSVIRFRRLPKLSATDLIDAEEWARSIQALMDYEDGQPSP